MILQKIYKKKFFRRLLQIFSFGRWSVNLSLLSLLIVIRQTEQVLLFFFQDTFFSSKIIDNRFGSNSILISLYFKLSKLNIFQYTLLSLILREKFTIF